MRAYVISPNEQAKSIHAASLKDVRKVIRERITKDSRDWARVTLEEFPHNQAAFIALKNGRDVPAAAVVKKWRLNMRGALVAIPVDQE